MTAAGRLDDQGGSAASGWRYYKILWVAPPSVNGAILIRGRRIDGPGELRFEGTENPVKELALTAPAGETPSRWSNWPSYTRLRAPGCYAYQIDGKDFSTTIVFQATPW
jgi:hypothetical protein